MANTLVPYPSQFSESVQLLYGHVSGGSVTRNTAIHAAYQIVGVGLGKFVPDPDSGSPTVGADSDCTFACGPEDCVVCDDETCCCDKVTEKKGKEALRKIAEEKGVRGPISALILQQIMAYALQLLMQWVINK